MKIEETLEKIVETREQVIEKAVKKNGYYTGTSLYKVWKGFHSVYLPGKFVCTPTGKQIGQLTNVAKRVEDLILIAMEYVIKNWIQYVKYCEANAGAFNVPLSPQIDFFVRFIEQAVQLSANLTNASKKSDNATDPLEGSVLV